MTEAEWLKCDHPQRMIQFLPRGSWSERRGRLFVVECCRRLPTLPDDRLKDVIKTAERFADGQADEIELGAAIGIALEVVEWEARQDMTSWQSHAAEIVAAAAAFPPEEYTAIDEFFAGVRGDIGSVRNLQARKALAGLVRDMAGNPFHPVTLDPAWLTSTVTALAKQMYDTRDFSAMPILADALQDAGCEDEQALSHCRGVGSHVRGCFVVDALLDKA